MSWYLPVVRNLGFVLRRFALIVASLISSPSLPAWPRAVLVFDTWVGRLTVIPVMTLLF